MMHLLTDSISAVLCGALWCSVEKEVSSDPDSWMGRNDLSVSLVGRNDPSDSWVGRNDPSDSWMGRNDPSGSWVGRNDPADSLVGRNDPSDSWVHAGGVQRSVMPVYIVSPWCEYGAIEWNISKLDIVVQLQCQFIIKSTNIHVPSSTKIQS